VVLVEPEMDGLGLNRADFVAVERVRDADVEADSVPVPVDPVECDLLVLCNYARKLDGFFPEVAR
jgi:hypothetical protein